MVSKTFGETLVYGKVSGGIRIKHLVRMGIIASLMRKKIIALFHLHYRRSWKLLLLFLLLLCMLRNR